MMKLLEIQDFVNNGLFVLGNNSSYSIRLINEILLLLLALLVTKIIYQVGKVFLPKFIQRKLIHKNKLTFVKVLFSHKNIILLVHFFAAIIFYTITKFLLLHINERDTLLMVANKLGILYVFVIILTLISYAISALNTFYENKFNLAKQYPIYSYLKVVILMVWLVGATIIVSYFLNTSPWEFLTGIGAVSAVLILVFKDTLLGIVASIQVTASNIVRIGDRITIDDMNIDGTVLDIAINTVKVKNFDNTVASIPTYTLTTKVVRNWRLLATLAARRFKGQITININCIKFCDQKLFQEIIASLSNCEMSHVPVLRYSSNLTNLTLYRQYVCDYLKSLAELNQSYEPLISFFDATTSGLIMEITAYTLDVSAYTNARVKAQVMEHCLALLPLFQLEIYQSVISS